MKIARLLLISLLTTLGLVWTDSAAAAVAGDVFNKDGVYYEIVSIDDRTVYAVGSSTSGSITVPEVVADSVNIGWNVIGIFYNLNYVWNNVTELSLPKTIKVIGGLSLKGIQITSLEIPEAVEYIGERALYNCTNLASITVAEGNTHFKAMDGVLYNYEATELLAYPAAKTGTTFNVPEGVTTMKVQAFCGNTKIRRVVLPASFTSLPAYIDSYSTACGANAFEGCSKLRSIGVASGSTTFSTTSGVLYNSDKTRLVYYPAYKGDGTTSFTIPSSVTTIATGAFYGAKSLKTVSMSSVKTIEDYAFKRCQKLTSFTVPSSVTSIGMGVFAGDVKLTSFDVASDNLRYKSVNGVLYSKGGRWLIAYPPGNSATSYTVETNTTRVRGEAFYSAKNLKSIIIPNTVVDLEKLAFFNCTSLSSVTFKETCHVSHIHIGAFRRCTSLSSITLPASLQILAERAFIECSALKNVTVKDGSQLTQIQDLAFYGDTKLNSFTFAGSSKLTNIFPQAFALCSSLKSFTFPATVASVGASAFNGCTSLTSAVFTTPAIITVLDDAVFQHCAFSSFTIPESVTTIKNSAFNSCINLPTIFIPTATTSIDPRAFQFCSSLKSIVVDDDNTTYSDCDGNLLSKDKTELVIFPAGKASKYFTLLPPSLTKLGDYSFYYCKQLENVCIPKKVTEIGDFAFDMCINLKAIAFLTENAIEAENVGKYAFFMSNISRQDITLYVRNGKETDYENNSLWSTFGGIKTSFIQDNKEYLPMSTSSVNLLNSNDDVHTLVVPQTVTDADGNEYDVRLIGDYAFEENTSTKLKEVVLKGAVGYVGARAFLNQNRSIENVFFVNKESDGTDGVSASLLCTKRFELEDLTDDNGMDYNEFTDGQNIYVRKSLEESFKENCPRYSDQTTYKIPFSQSRSLGTFAREFDTDFSDFGWTTSDITTPSGMSEPLVIAYTGFDSREMDDNGNYRVKMTSIFLGDAEKDGVYVPANTGVIIRSYQPSLTSVGGDNSYYRIGEQDLDEYTEENSMMAQVVDDGEISVEDGVTQYYVYNNQLKRLTSTKKMPVHRAWLRLNGELPANAKLSVSFEGGAHSSTAVELMEDAGNGGSDGKAYDLSGRRTSKNTRGIVIENGKKYLNK